MNQSLKILVVDDSMITVKKLEKLLVDIGHEVIHRSKTGLEAITHYKDFLPDLVTMDITMPDMDGIEATKRILAIDPDALIIMVTSHGQENMVMDAIDAGAKGYVLKPIRIEKLTDTIDKVLTRYRK